VLDKHRFATVCFNGEGRFLGEFGGQGTAPGWFYHPTWIAVDGADRAYIGQIFQNRIQVCAVPASISRVALALAGNPPSTRDVLASRSGAAAPAAEGKEVISGEN
jgi:hypothetical protein